MPKCFIKSSSYELKPEEEIKIIAKQPE